MLHLFWLPAKLCQFAQKAGQDLLALELHWTLLELPHSDRLVSGSPGEGWCWPCYDVLRMLWILLRV